MSILQRQLLAQKEKLKPTTTIITSTDGTQLVEGNVDGDRIIIKETHNVSPGFVVDTKPDLRIHEVVKGLFIGSQDVAQDLSLMLFHNITHILNISTGIQNFFEQKLIYFNVQALDTPEYQLINDIYSCIFFIEGAIKAGGNVLVHCNAGVSRSAAVVIGYVMHCHRKPFLEAYEIVRQKRPYIKPNDGFINQLKQFEELIKL